MSCIITYKGKKYSEEQFKEYFINNKNEFATSISKNKNVIDSFKRKMKGVDINLYSQYLEQNPNGSVEQFKSWVDDRNNFNKELAQKIQDKLEKLYPEIKLNITNNPVWEQGDNIFNQEEYINQVNYRLKAIEILLSDKAKQVFAKGEKAKWDLNRILTELQVPKEQKQLLLDLNIKDNKPDVILPIGTSGSGKSTFIKSLPKENLVVIEPDVMRVEFTGDINNKSKDKEIYIEAANRAIAAIKQGKQVVFDTTNLTKDKRLPFIEAIKKAIPTANIQYKLMELKEVNFKLDVK